VYFTKEKYIKLNMKNKPGKCFTDSAAVKRFTGSLLAIGIVIASSAQLSVSCNFRNRGEFRHGQGELPDSSKRPALFVNQRTRLIFDYNNPKYLVNITIQDARVWGDTEPKHDNSSIEMFEAWIKYFFTDKLAVKFGRQRLIYDDQRLLSETNWNNRGTSHDLAVIQYENTDRSLSCHLGLGLNNLSEDRYLSDYKLNYYKYLSYIWLSKKLSNTLDISVIDILDANQKPDQKNIIYARNTAGTNLNYKLKKLNVQAIFYLQHGNIKTGEKVLSHFYSAKASCNIFKNTSLILGYDHYSGTDLSDTIKTRTKNNSFSKLYGSNHRFLGYMDYFTKDIASENHGAGINNLFLRVENNISGKISTQITCHWFSLDKEYLSPANKVEKYLGSEIDLVFKYKPVNYISLQAGYSFMLPNSTLEIINEIEKGESKFAQFGWLQIQFMPTFYSKTNN
jgi:hypothetical protein